MFLVCTVSSLLVFLWLEEVEVVQLLSISSKTDVKHE